VQVELLYVDGCPGYRDLRGRVESLLAGLGRGRLELMRVESPEDAEARRFLGSPTLRVDGHDVDPSAEARTDFGLKCRLYPSEEGLRRAPSDLQILAALGGERPPGAPPRSGEGSR
jgi:hypothetical protein